MKTLLLQPYGEPLTKPKIYLKQWEYDSLGTIDDQPFSSNKRNMEMKKLGYYKGVTDTSMRTKDIRENAVIVPENYFDEHESEWC